MTMSESLKKILHSALTVIIALIIAVVSFFVGKNMQVDAKQNFWETDQISVSFNDKHLVVYNLKQQRLDFYPVEVTKYIFAFELSRVGTVEKQLKAK